MMKKTFLTLCMCTVLTATFVAVSPIKSAEASVLAPVSQPFAEWTFKATNENWASVGFIQTVQNGLLTLQMSQPAPTTTSRLFKPYFFVNQAITLPAGQNYFNMIIAVRAIEDPKALLTPFQTLGFQYQLSDGTWSEQEIIELYQVYPGEILTLSVPLQNTQALTIQQVKLTALWPNRIGTIFDIDYMSLSDTPLAK